MNDYIERLNWAHDHRNIERDKAPVLYVEAPDGCIDEIQLPTRWEVCPTCDGNGTHVNPSIDCGGLSAEVFQDDPDFAEDYANGRYNVPCNNCGGRTTVQAVDWDQLTPEQAEQYTQQLRDEAYDMACRRAEMAMGA